MMTAQEYSASHQELLRTFFDPDVQRCIHAIEEIAGYHLPDTARQGFLRFHRYITAEPPPEFITRWRSEPELEHWYRRHVGGVLTDTQEALTCVYYHRERLLEIEAQILAELETHDYKVALKNCIVALPNTRKWDFEYQAFVLAVRRCLDYLTRALAAFFQNEYHSFRTFPKLLCQVKPRIVAERLAQVHESYVSRFAYVLSEGGRKSTRDKISHYEYVPAGTVNLGSRGFVLAGGGERLSLEQEEPVLLSSVINQRVADLQECVDAMLNAYVDAADEHYRS